MGNTCQGVARLPAHDTVALIDRANEYGGEVDPPNPIVGFVEPDIADVNVGNLTSGAADEDRRTRAARARASRPAPGS